VRAKYATSPPRMPDSTRTAIGQLLYASLSGARDEVIAITGWRGFHRGFPAGLVV
jgi:hypothetical protein